MANSATFEACLALAWQFDGLRDDHASGEKFATSYGVTEMTWADAEREGIVTHGIATATKAECASILRVMYWNAPRASMLNPGVNLMVFNDAMVTGVGHSVRLLQRIVGATEDGVAGPKTVEMANGMSPAALIDALAKGDDAYYAALAKAPLFLKGWERRETYMASQAHRMLSA